MCVCTHITKNDGGGIGSLSCPREDNMRDIHVSEDQLPNLSLYQTNGERLVLQRAADSVSGVESAVSIRA